MKRLIIIMIALLSAGSAYAQTDEVKGFQVNTTVRYDWYNGNTSFWNAMVSVGSRLDRENYIGIETGFGIHARYSKNIKSIPVLLDYIHYYPLGKTDRHSVYLGVEAGAMIQRWYWQQYPHANHYTELFTSAKIGFDFALGRRGPHLIVGGQINFWGAGATLGLAF